MVRSLTIGFAAALALTMVASAAGAQTMPRRHHQPVVHPGDIVVHAGRSYLDPGPATWNEVGTGNRYVGDTTPSSFLDYGPFATNPGSFAVLPSRFNPPGPAQPLFVF
jgi:hypothetical protein